MHDRSPGHYAPKYKKAVMKFQIDVTFLGRIARLSRWYEGSVHDGTIYEDNFDGEPVVGDKAYIGKPLCVTASRGQVSPAQELRNQVLPPLPLPHLLTIACLTLPPPPSAADAPDAEPLQGASRTCHRASQAPRALQSHSAVAGP